jgi:hypothetical protein
MAKTGKTGVKFWTEPQAKRAARKIWESMGEIKKKHSSEITSKDVCEFCDLLKAFVTVCTPYVSDGKSPEEWLNEAD